MTHAGAVWGIVLGVAVISGLVAQFVVVPWVIGHAHAMTDNQQRMPTVTSATQLTDIRLQELEAGKRRGGKQTEKERVKEKDREVDGASPSPYSGDTTLVPTTSPRAASASPAESDPLNSAADNSKDKEKGGKGLSATTNVSAASPSPSPSPDQLEREEKKEKKEKKEKEKKSFWQRAMDKVAYGINVDVKALQEEGVSKMHDVATKYDPVTENCFTMLLVFTSAFASFAHGANDLANAVGPLRCVRVACA